MSRRSDRAQAGIPPWIDNFGRPVWNNPCGQYRPNTRGLTAEPVAIAPVLEPVVAPTTALPTKPDPRAAYEALVESGEADRIRGTLEYAKGYAKACQALGLEVPEEVELRLRDQLAARRSGVHKRVRRTVAAAAVVGAGAVGMNSAAAFFTSGGSGSGNATAGTIDVSVEASTTPGSPLYPGGTGTVRVSIENQSDVAVTLKKVEGDGPITATPSCSPTGVTFTDQTGLNTNLPAGQTTVVDLAGAASMSNASATECQGATFTIPVTVSVQQP